MSIAIVVREAGGPEVMRVEDREVGDPGPGEIKIRNHAIGLNFIDVYQRTGLYPMKLPFVPGSEGAGEVIAVGDGVTRHKVGDRVAYSGPIGAYAAERLMPADRSAPLPAGVDFESAAAVTLKGTTAYYLIHLTYAVKPGDTILVHAAAGGTGQLISRWSKALGATVIGTAGSPEKVSIAEANGCDEVIDYRKEDFVSRVREFTGGKGVDVVYDGVGKTTFEPSLDCLKPRGLMVSFGNASGVVSIPDLTILSRKGSLYVTRPTTASYFAKADEYRAAAAAVFKAVEDGILKPGVAQSFALKDAAEAHRALESRATTGSTLLRP